MTTYVALIRGINLGGSNRLSMADLKEMLEKNRCVDVQTYVQSGNAVFRSAATAPLLAKQLTATVSAMRAFEPLVIVLTGRELERAAAAIPYAEADENPKTLHVFFLAERPMNPDLQGLEALKARTEHFALQRKVFYLYTPDGFGRSRLAQGVERLLGVEATARNWRTVTTLVEMARKSS